MIVSDTTPRYADVLGASSPELQRLLQQAKDLEPEARWLLDRIGVAQGWRTIDVGCGPLGILDALSERVGPHDEVVGLDLESRFVEMARRIVDERRLDNVRVMHGDATATGLPRGSFDLVHERLLLIGPLRERVLAEMVALTKPGGFVAVQELDLLSSFCEPAHPAWDTLLAAFGAFVGRAGADLTTGRRLPALLRQVGLVDVDAEVHTRLAHPDEPRRSQLLSLIASVREPLLHGGVFSDEELSSLITALQAHLEDSRTVVVGGLVVQAWGRKP
jgi:SAM-dependent methyltransferase